MIFIYSCCCFFPVHTGVLQLSTYDCVGKDSLSVQLEILHRWLWFQGGNRESFSIFMQEPSEARCMFNRANYSYPCIYCKWRVNLARSQEILCGENLSYTNTIIHLSGRSESPPCHITKCKLTIYPPLHVLPWILTIYSYNLLTISLTSSCMFVWFSKQYLKSKIHRSLLVHDQISFVMCFLHSYEFPITDYTSFYVSWLAKEPTTLLVVYWKLNCGSWGLCTVCC